MLRELTLENFKLRRELEFYESLEAAVGGRLYESTMAAAGLEPADRHSPGVQQLLAAARGAVGDG